MLNALVLSGLLALALVAVCASWSARRRATTRPLGTRALSLLAQAWLLRPARHAAPGALDAVARRLVVEALRLGRHVDDDPRLVLPTRLDLVAHPADIRVFRAHGARLADACAVVVHRELGLLCLPFRPVVLVLEADESRVPGRPRLDVAATPPPAPRSVEVGRLQRQVAGVGDAGDDLVGEGVRRDEAC